jgi:hypothetical protein
LDRKVTFVNVAPGESGREPSKRKVVALPPASSASFPTKSHPFIENFSKDPAANDPYYERKKSECLTFGGEKQWKTEYNH